MKGVYTACRKNGTAVCISYSPPGERRVRETIELVPEGRGFAKRLRAASKRAEKALVTRQAAIVEGKYGLVRPQKRMTLARFVETIYADDLRQRGIRTAEKEIERITTAPLGRYFGPVQLADLTEFRIRRYLKDRKDGKMKRGGKGGYSGVSAGGLNRDLARLSNLWNAAKRRGLVSGENPCRLVGRLEEPEGRVRYLTPEEESRLLAALRPDVRRIVEVGLHTGIRLKALLGLRWNCADLSLGQIAIPRELDKAKKGYRVALNPRVREILAELPRHSEYVFPAADGTPRQSIRTAFQAACRRAEIEDFRFHDLRHTAASRIVMAGGSLYDAGQHLGHRTPSMTARYAHLSPGHMRDVAALTMAPKPAEVIGLENARGSVTRLSRGRAAGPGAAS